MGFKLNIFQVLLPEDGGRPPKQGVVRIVYYFFYIYFVCERCWCLRSFGIVDSNPTCSTDLGILSLLFCVDRDLAIGRYSVPKGSVRCLKRIHSSAEQKDYI
jgi:hypothetical protein